jgi:hypothetical protein
MKKTIINSLLIGAAGKSITEKYPIFLSTNSYFLLPCIQHVFLTQIILAFMPLICFFWESPFYLVLSAFENISDFHLVG